MSDVAFVPLHYPDVVYIARHMRRQDREEFAATAGPQTPETIAAYTCAHCTDGFVALVEGIPVATFGASVITPGRHIQLFMYATDRWEEVALPASLLIRRHLVRYRDTSYTRAQAVTLGTYEWAHRWMETLGMRKEAVLHDYGWNRETFFIYAWTRSDADALVATRLAPRDDKET
jgi:hypothetical protein